MYLTLSQYARKAGVKPNTIAQRIKYKHLEYELIEGKKMIDTEKFPPLGKQRAGVKKGMRNALKKNRQEKTLESAQKFLQDSNLISKYMKGEIPKSVLDERGIKLAMPLKTKEA